MASATLILLVLVAGAFQVVQLNNLPEPRDFDRIIIFAEPHSEMFQAEKTEAVINIEGLFGDAVLEILKREGYEVSIAVGDFHDPEMVSTVKRLNTGGIKVWVWPLHPLADGYWLSADNAAEFPRLYEKFQRWVKDNELEVTGVMLDMEPSYADVELLRKKAKEGGIFGTLVFLTGRRDRELHLKAKNIYDDMVKKIKADGYEVSTFNYPYVLDDALDGDSSIAEMFHIVQVDSDVSVYMLYRSFFKDSGLGAGSANIVSYARASAAKGGSVGIGNYLSDDLDFSDFEADIRIAARYSPVLHIYNLEALVTRGWLEKIADIDHNKPVRTPLPERIFIVGYRTFFFSLDLFSGMSGIYSFLILAVIWLLPGIYFYRRISRKHIFRRRDSESSQAIQP